MTGAKEPNGSPNVVATRLRRKAWVSTLVVLDDRVMVNVQRTVGGRYKTDVSLEGHGVVFL